MHTDAIAIRTFADCVNDPDHAFGKNPHDYTIFFIGTFDDETGLISKQTPETLGNGVQFVKTDTPDQIGRAHV